MVFFLEYIEPLYFFLAFIIGLVIVYFIEPPHEIIIKYPTPDNAGKIVYKDDAEVCYLYEANEVKCPSDKSIIKEIDLQHKEKNIL